MLPRRFVPAAALAHTNIRIYAPNGTKIPVMVAVTIQFEVEGVPVNCEFLVSNAIDEPMLGIDWLVRNNCTWDFVRGVLLIAGKEVPLVARPCRPVVRRVYVIDRVVVPPRSQVNVPVRLAWVAFKRGVNNTEWVLETKHTPLGVVVARSLLAARIRRLSLAVARVARSQTRLFKMAGMETRPLVEPATSPRHRWYGPATSPAILCHI